MKAKCVKKSYPKDCIMNTNKKVIFVWELRVLLFNSCYVSPEKQWYCEDGHHKEDDTYSESQHSFWIFSYILKIRKLHAPIVH